MVSSRQKHMSYIILTIVGSPSEKELEMKITGDKTKGSGQICNR